MAAERDSGLRARVRGVLDRTRRFWLPRSEDDHPLTEEERREDRPASTYDERAEEAERFVGGDFDPDDKRRG
jgi:hypothetical protein